MPQFDTATFASQIFWLLCSFMFLCIVMRFIIVPRLTISMETREQRIQEDWNQSKTLSTSGETLRKENLSHLSEAHAKAHALLHQAIQEIHHRKSERFATLDEELTIKTKIIHDDLENQTRKILENIEPLVSQVIKEISPQILGRSLTQTEARRHVLSALKQEN